MADLHATLRLRPTRVGFLVRPSDPSSIRRAMRASMTLWGGVMNPLIPVCRYAPSEWKNDPLGAAAGPSLTRAYAQFFEPDVYVETEEGLLDRGGLSGFRRGEIASRVLSLAGFTRDHRGYAEPQLGLPVSDVLSHQFETERRFTLRHKQPAVVGGAGTDSLFGLNVIGSFPRKDFAYLTRGYRDVFEPDEVSTDVAGWRRIFLDGAMTPRRATMLGLEVRRSWRHDPIIYLFDPTNPRDAIDLWNLRLEGSPVWPVPFDWIDALKDDLRSLIVSEHRPLRGNAHGVMHQTTIEVARSLDKELIGETIRSAFSDLPVGSLALKHWRTPVWRPVRPGQKAHYRRADCTADSKRISLRDLGSTTPGQLRSEFETLTPKCAEEFSGGQARWANVLSFSGFWSQEPGTILPFNTFDRDWPRNMSAARTVGITSEGWVLLQDYNLDRESITIPAGDFALIEWMATKGVSAELSEPGRIAKDVLSRLGGLHGAYLIANRETMRLLNKMAGAVRRRTTSEEGIEESFPNRTVASRVWEDHLSKRAKTDWGISLSRFTAAKVLRLGLETSCPHCKAPNWRGLDVVDYALICDRCLNAYDFPQAKSDHGDASWRYRAIGPFSIPDYGRGAYASVLVLRALAELLNTTRSAITYSSALTLRKDSAEVEIDLAAWVDWASEHDVTGEPSLILGEAKSFGEEAIRAFDLQKLKQAARWLDGSVLVVAVLKDEFSRAEKHLLLSFAKWARERTPTRWVRHDVILLTGIDLFAQRSLSAAWEADSTRAKYAKALGHADLEHLAEITQAIHLGLPHYSEEKRTRQTARKKRGT